MLGLLTAAVLSVGCKSDCEKALDNRLALIEAEAEAAAEPQQKAWQLEAERVREDRAKLLSACAKQKPKQIKCAIDAKTLAEGAGCWPAP